MAFYTLTIKEWLYVYIMVCVVVLMVFMVLYGFEKSEKQVRCEEGSENVCYMLCYQLQDNNVLVKGCENYKLVIGNEGE